MKIQIESNIIRHMLRNAYFINGTAFAGKSTITRLLAQRHGGICCRENYHDELMGALDKDRQPSLCYFETMSGWQEFIGRTPAQYAAWIDGCAREAAEIEIALLLRMSQQGKKLFVDTNIPVEILREIASDRHVALMLCPQRMSADRFFDREDGDKQFILRQIQAAPDPAAAMANYRACLLAVNSQENYNAFARSGFHTYVRTESSTIQDALADIEGYFGLAHNLRE